MGINHIWSSWCLHAASCEWWGCTFDWSLSDTDHRQTVEISDARRWNDFEINPTPKNNPWIYSLDVDFHVFEIAETLWAILAHKIVFSGMYNPENKFKTMYDG